MTAYELIPPFPCCGGDPMHVPGCPQCIRPDSEPPTRPRTTILPPPYHTSVRRARFAPRRDPAPSRESLQHRTERTTIRKLRAARPAGGTK